MEPFREHLKKPTEKSVYLDEPSQAIFLSAKDTTEHYTATAARDWILYYASVLPVHI